MALTDRQIEATKANGKDQWLSDGNIRGKGTLYLRVTKGGAKLWMFRYMGTQGRGSLTLGDYDREGKKGKTLMEARAKADELNALYRSGIKDLKDHFQAEREAEAREREAERQAAIEAENARLELERQAAIEAEKARRGSLKALLEVYLEHLEAKGKLSVGQVQNRLTNHVIKPWPRLAEKPAADITGGEITQVLRKMTKAGLTRQVNLVRSDLHAAYRFVLNSINNPAITSDLEYFNLKTNPAATVAVVAEYNRARNRNLSWSELDAYLRRVQELPSPVIKDALLFSLYSGGQRVRQMLRAQFTDIDKDSNSITIYDPKGKRIEPRRHTLPITGVMAGIIQRRQEQAIGPWLFSTKRKVSLRPETLNAHVQGIAEAMLEAGEAAEYFSLGDIRRTCETKFGEMGLSKDLKAQLQSHGLAGVQDRHYDRYLYLPEKRAALEAWADRLNGLALGGNVVQLRRDA